MFQTSALHQSEWRNFWLCVCLYLENINTHRTHNSSIHSDVGNLLQWPMHVINSADNTKLPYHKLDL